MKRINLGFSKFSDADLEVFSQAVLAAMTNNPNFPGSPAELTAAAAAVAAFATALFNARTGSRLDVAVKNDKRNELIVAFTVLGNYVMSVAAGSEPVLVSSGFSLNKTRSTQPPLAPITDVALTDGQTSGDLVVTVKRVTGARMYAYQYTPDPLLPASEWTSQTATTSKFTFKSLQSGKRYWCRVMAMGIGEQVVVSEPVSRVVQ